MIRALLASLVAGQGVAMAFNNTTAEQGVAITFHNTTARVAEQRAVTAFAINKQCALPYKNLSGAWRSIANDCSDFNGPSKDCKKGAGGPGGNNMGDTFPGDVNCVGNRQATGVGNGGWYRFVGAGDALPLRPPGGQHCGTEIAGWLSGWSAPPGCVYPKCFPPRGYSMPGRYPAATEGMKEMTVCWDSSYPGQHEQCSFHVLVQVVRCDGFLLWRLPYAGSCGSAYCSTKSVLTTAK